jgi:hypothetical protein
MSCCGKARSNIVPAPTVARPATFLFEYVGLTRLSVVGFATRTHYRFDQPGARVLVNGRDRANLATIPTLRLVNA